MLNVAVSDLIVGFKLLLLDELLGLFVFRWYWLVLDPTFVLFLYPWSIDLDLFLCLLVLLYPVKHHGLWLKDLWLLLLNFTLVLFNRYCKMVHLDASFEGNRHRAWIRLGLLLLAALACIAVVPFLATAADGLVVGTSIRLLVFGSPYI